MNIAIIGLGLIGGSFAKAYKTKAGNRVFGADTDRETLSYAMLSETIDGVVTDEKLKECELVILALYPDETVKYLKDKASFISKDAIVIDTCGTKRVVCEKCFAIAKEHGFTFVGGHPMAGIQFSGIKYSRADLFKGASMIVVPEKLDDIWFMEKIKNMLSPMEFGHITIGNAKEHDEIIAFTSQLAHIVSSAYIKSDTAKKHHGFSAGSYKDMTRVATLNEEMWSELFLQNADNLTHELDNIIDALSEYRKAISEQNKGALTELLKDGSRCKKLVDGYTDK